MNSYIFRIILKTIIAHIKLSYAARNPLLLFQSSCICKGELKIKGRIYGFRHSHISVEKGGSIILEDGVWFSDCIVIRCSRRITVGKDSRIGPFCSITDTTYKNLGTSKIGLIEGEIYIGKSSYIGSHSLISGTSEIKDYSMVVSHSNIVNNIARRYDFSSYDPVVLGKVFKNYTSINSTSE